MQFEYTRYVKRAAQLMAVVTASLIMGVVVHPYAGVAFGFLSVLARPWKTLEGVFGLWAMAWLATQLWGRSQHAVAPVSHHILESRKDYRDGTEEAYRDCR